MDPASPPLSGLVTGDLMPAELLAAFVEVVLESSEHLADAEDAPAVAS